MGNEQSMGGHSNGDGLFFVYWGGDETSTYHFAEPSSYQFAHSQSNYSLTGAIVATDPPKADHFPLRNASELAGNIALVERGGRSHFPDIMDELFGAGVAGCLFIEREEQQLKQQLAARSLYEGFHSSGRKKVQIPIVRLAKPHADQLLRDGPANITIKLLYGKKAIKHLRGILPIDLPVAIASAARMGEVDVLKHLLFRDTEGTFLKSATAAYALCDAVENGHVDCIEVLHAFGISLDVQKPNGTSPLMVACSTGKIEAVRALLMYGANLDLEDVHGMTALMVAARDGSTSCMMQLIRKGANINLSRNRQRGSTALHVAARSGSVDCLKVLIDAGAFLDVESTNSSTALMEAARSGNYECVKILVEAGASMNTKDKEGNTAETLARLAGHDEIEDYLRGRAENECVRHQRRLIEAVIEDRNVSLDTLFTMAEEENINIDVLLSEALRNQKITSWLKKPEIVVDVLRHLSTSSVSKDFDTLYGYHKIQHFCCEIAIWYDRSIFEVPSMRSTKKNSTQGRSNILEHVIDEKKAFNYFNVLFNFLYQSLVLDEVVVVLFCRVVNNYILHRSLGPLVLSYISKQKGNTIYWLRRHIGLDSIKDILIWLLYSDLSDEGQQNISDSNILYEFIDHLMSWQRTLGWCGTHYQRDAIDNICAVINSIISPPAVYAIGDMVTFVDNCHDVSLPLLTDQWHQKNALLATLLKVLTKHCYQDQSNILADLTELGLKGLQRVVDNNNSLTYTKETLMTYRGGSLSIVMNLMDLLGYKKVKREISGMESYLEFCKTKILEAIIPCLSSFVGISRIIVASSHNRRNHNSSSVLLTVISFLKAAIFLQVAEIDEILAEENCVQIFLACFHSHSSNSLLHHELTDIIRFVLLDPSQQRKHCCPLLHSLFVSSYSSAASPSSSLHIQKSNWNILEFVMESYDDRLQYKGHMTTIANSIVTLTSTPVYKDTARLTSQEVVNNYVCENEKWSRFVWEKLANQNTVERESLGKRIAPLCDGCLQLNEQAIQYVTSTKQSDLTKTGYVETLFHNSNFDLCKVNVSQSSVMGYLFKKDKKHDHIPVPEPTSVSSFIQYPVPMPFHALTFTITFFGLCCNCGKLWYCDSLLTANWNNRMKWVLPTSVKSWYSFGTSEGPHGGAHGIQFSTKGYKNFIVLVDTWSRQEQWIQAIQSGMSGICPSSTGSSNRNSSSKSRTKINDERALAIEIDNEVEIFDNDAVVEEISRAKKVRSQSFSGHDLDSNIIKNIGSNDFPQRNRSASTKGIKHRNEFYRRKEIADLNSSRSKKKGLGVRHVVSTPDLQALS